MYWFLKDNKIKITRHGKCLWFYGVVRGAVSMTIVWRHLTKKYDCQLCLCQLDEAIPVIETLI